MKRYLVSLFLMLLITQIPAIQAYSLNITGLAGGAAAYHGLGDHPDSIWYTPFSINDTSDGNLTLIKVPSLQQASEFTCGAAVVIDNLQYYGQNGDEMTIAEEMGTVPIYGVNVEQISKWFTDKGWTVHSSLTDGDGNLTMLQENLKAGIPTLVGWADWGGHWMVVTGYDTMGTDTVVDDIIIFADPYDVTDHTQDGYYRFPASRFYSLWFVPHWFPDMDAVRPWLTATPPLSPVS